MLYFLSVRILLELLWNLFLNFPQRANLLLTFIEAWNPGVWKPKFDHKNTFSLGPGVVALSASLKKTSLVLTCFHFGRSCFVYTYPNLTLGSISTLVSRMNIPGKDTLNQSLISSWSPFPVFTLEINQPHSLWQGQSCGVFPQLVTFYL